MPTICTAKYVWTPDELIQAMQQHHSVGFRKEFRILLKVTCALLLSFVLLVVIVSLVYPYDQPAPYWSLILTSVICVYGLIYDRVNVWVWRRGFRKRPDADTLVEWVFKVDAIETKTPLGEASVRWKTFIKIVEVDDGFLFYSMEKFFHWIPFHSFDSEDCIVAVRNLILKNECPFIQRK